MRILYAALRWDYGRPEQGDSFEHQTFYQALSGMGHDLLYFDYHSLLREKGRDQMNRLLWETVRTEEPDAMFCVLFGEELDRGLVRRISEETSTVTINWFCDDHWRFHDFSRFWAPCFNWIVTTVGPDLAPYEDLGLDNVIRSQWACNRYTYKRPTEPAPLDYDISFVGMAHGNRSEYVEALERNEMRVQTWGYGWPAGRISVAEMVRVFSHTRINLNFSNASVSTAQVEGRAPQFGRTRGALRSLPGGRRILTAGRRLANRAWSPRADRPRYGAQLKARTFEVPGCGGFLLTQDAPALEEYLLPGLEVGTFEDPSSLVDAVRYYLSNEDERHQIAQAGYRRVIRDHTYERRFDEIFFRTGLSGGGS